MKEAIHRIRATSGIKTGQNIDRPGPEVMKNNFMFNSVEREILSCS